MDNKTGKDNQTASSKDDFAKKYWLTVIKLFIVIITSALYIAWISPSNNKEFLSVFLFVLSLYMLAVEKPVSKLLRGILSVFLLIVAGILIY